MAAEPAWFPSAGVRPRVALVLLLAAAALLCVGAAAGFWLRSVQHRARLAVAITGGDPLRAPPLIRRFGCGGCHTISALPGADGKVGPSLDGLRARVYVGGALRNSPDNLVSWIVAPEAFSPDTAMPVTGITEVEARDVAAFLYAQ